MHGSWHAGRIIAIDTKFRVITIKYDNGQLEKHVPPSRVQPMSSSHVRTAYARGERVRANWGGCGTWCLGRVCAVHEGEGTYNVLYEDGELEVHVAPHRLQPAELSEPKLEMGGPSVEALPRDALPFACSLGSKVGPAGASLPHAF